MGSVGYIFFVFVTLAVFAVYEVPQANQQVINIIIGMLLSSAGQVVYTLIGRDTTELDRLRSENELLVEKNRTAQVNLLQVRAQLSDLQTKVVDKLSLIGATHEVPWYSKSYGNKS